MTDALTALVLSAGGMYGAYQAGAWQVVSGWLRPDLVVGASIGSLNGWAIAGGCNPAEWAATWRHFHAAANHRLRFPRAFCDGVVDPTEFEHWVQDLHAAFTPRIDYALTVTEIPTLVPRIVRAPQVTWRHLAASCAVFGVFPQYLIDGVRYSDGGLLGALPLWAAAELGARRIVAIDVMKPVPEYVRTILRVPKLLSKHRPSIPADVEVVSIAPGKCLGSAKEALFWSEDAVRRWIEQGEEDALRVRRPSGWPTPSG